MKNTKHTKQQKKDSAVIAVLSIVAVVLLVFCVRAFRTDSVPVADTTVSAEVTSQTAIATTAKPSETTEPAETTKPPETIKAPETKKAPETTAPAVDEKEEILKVVSDSVNLLKSSEVSFTGHKEQDINIKLVDSSVPYVNNIINSVINMFVKEERFDYDFTNGISPDPEGDGTVDADDTFPPGDKPFELTVDGVASATKTVDGANTVYTVVIVAEKSTLENPRPPHHNAGADTLDLSGIEIPIVTLTRVDFDYPGATVSVTLNSEGEIVGYYEHLPISGTGEGNGLGITGFGTIEGYLEKKWDIRMK